MNKNVYSVGQINSYIKNLFSQDFMLHRISIRGEVSNCKYHSSGHIYFTLKDGTGSLAAVMFAGNRKGLTFPMQDGDKVVASGSVEVYERDGKYQLYAREIEPDGQGELFRRFEKLKEELSEMGMFAPEYKKEIPKYARRIGIVTAETGAAIQDIQNITARRNPYVQLILAPAQVQGEGAVPSIVSAIRRLDALGVDVMIVGRGGGSFEDLFAFNEEPVVRAIFECETPVISAVGHETDTTLSDYAADLRAPTPSAAAELAVFDLNRTLSELEGYRISMERSFAAQLSYVSQRLRAASSLLSKESPESRVREQRGALRELSLRLDNGFTALLTERKHRLTSAAGTLSALSPLQKISRGFGYLSTAEGRSVKSAKELAAGDKIGIRLSDGAAEAEILKVSTF